MRKEKLKKKSQLWLDVGAGDNPQPGCVAMDKRKRPGIDVVHDAEKTPWPFESDTFDRIIMSHIMEHLDPKRVNFIMDEMWRILKPHGCLMIAMPYAGSFGFYQDPTHIKAWNEATPTYYDPDYPLYNIYKLKPWKIKANVWHMDGNLEVAFEPRKNGYKRKGEK